MNSILEKIQKNLSQRNIFALFKQKMWYFLNILRRSHRLFLGLSSPRGPPLHPILEGYKDLHGTSQRCAARENLAGSAPTMSAFAVSIEPHDESYRISKIFRQRRTRTLPALYNHRGCCIVAIQVESANPIRFTDRHILYKCTTIEVTAEKIDPTEPVKSTFIPFLTQISLIGIRGWARRMVRPAVNIIIRVESHKRLAAVYEQ